MRKLIVLAVLILVSCKAGRYRCDAYEAKPFVKKKNIRK